MYPPASVLIIKDGHKSSFYSLYLTTISILESLARVDGESAYLSRAVQLFQTFPN